MGSLFQSGAFQGLSQQLHHNADGQNTQYQNDYSRKDILNPLVFQNLFQHMFHLLF